MEINKKVWVITGGGSGMGRELTLQMLNNGAKVAICDINQEAMEETAKLAGENSSNLSIHKLDITDKEKVFEFPQKVIDTHGTVDGIINNAGIIQPFIKVQDLEMKDIDRVLNINLYGVIYMTKAFLPHLLKRPEAHIVNTSSMGGFLPVPGQTIYGASKAAVKLFTEGLNSELKETNVSVTVVFPGAIETNITTNSGVNIPSVGEDSGGSGMTAMPADNAASIIIKGIQKNKYRVLVGSDAKFMDFIYRLSPKRAAGFIYNKMKGLLS